MNSGIYIIISPSNRCYIGSTNNFARRETKHFYNLRLGNHHCHALQAAWDKYGDQLRFIIIERCDVSKLIEREQWWIDKHAWFWGRMYNSSSIAGRPEHTPEVRAKIAAAQRGRKHTPEHKAKVVAALRKRRHSDETKAKMSRIIRSSPERIEQIRQLGKTNVMSQKQKDRIAAIGRAHKGRKMTDEHRANMSAAQQKRYLETPVSEATREKLRQPKSLETRAKMAAAKKAYWTPELKAAQRQRAQEQRLREHMDRLNWILAG